MFLLELLNKCVTEPEKRAGIVQVSDHLPLQGFCDSCFAFFLYKSSKTAPESEQEGAQIHPLFGFGLFYSLYRQKSVQ